MQHGRYRRPSGSVAFGHAQLWLGAVLLYGVADLLATVAGLGIGALLETGPVAVPLLEAVGPWTLVGARLAGAAGCYALWVIFPDPRRAVWPTLLALLGAVLAGVRLLVVSATLLG